MFVRPRVKKSLLPPPTKRRKINSTIEEINFDLDARADYLTGFHKRKLQRAKQAQEEAEKKARQERIAQRKQLRDERRHELEEHVNSVNEALKNANRNASNDDEDSNSEAWNGIQDEAPIEVVDHQENYIDEDRYTTVTVEEVEVTKEGFNKVANDNDMGFDVEDGDPSETEKASGPAQSSSKKVWPKKSRKKFRYESKIDRKIARGKQKAGNKAKADARRGYV